jgi:hypothetical protein
MVLQDIWSTRNAVLAWPGHSDHMPYLRTTEEKRAVQSGGNQGLQFLIVLEALQYSESFHLPMMVYIRERLHEQGVNYCNGRIFSNHLEVCHA